jgi:hypothetical protein
VISGTPLQIENSLFDVQVKDSLNSAIQRQYNISIEAPPPPDVFEPAADATQVSPAANFVWEALASAVSYQIMIATTQEALPTSALETTCAACVVNAVTSAPNFSPTLGTLRANTTYFWQVKADFLGGSGEWSAHRLTTRAPDFTFSDDPLVARATIVRAQHLLELRDAINERRARLGLQAFNFSDPPIAGKPIGAEHVLEVRAALAEAVARAERTLPATEPITKRSTIIKASHMSDLRVAVEALR